MAVTAYLGFKPFTEGTVMALAGTGGPSYAKKFRELVRLEPEGRFSINRDLISYNTHGIKKPFKEWFTEAFGPPRQPDEPISDRHRDLAFALQSTIEAAVVHMARALSKRHPSRILPDRRRGSQLRGERAYLARHGLRGSLGTTLRLGFGRSPRQRTLALSSNARSSARIRADHSFHGRGYTDAEIRADFNRWVVLSANGGEELLRPWPGTSPMARSSVGSRGDPSLARAHLEIAPSWQIPGMKQ